MDDLGELGNGAGGELLPLKTPEIMTRKYQQKHFINLLQGAAVHLDCSLKLRPPLVSTSCSVHPPHFLSEAR